MIHALGKLIDTFVDGCTSALKPSFHSPASKNDWLLDTLSFVGIAPGANTGHHVLLHS